MEQSVNCFQWESHSSDFLDETLEEGLQRAANAHLKSCKACSERSKHYKVILATLAEQPTQPLPESLKEAPYASPLPKLESAKISFSRWERLPWYIRTILEGMGIVIVILVGISSAPKMRSLYESKIEKTLSDFRESLMSRDSHSDNTNGAIPPLQAFNAALNDANRPTQDDLSGEGEDEEEAPRPGKSPHGRSQLWRFTLKTVSPEELRPQVVKALRGLGVPASTPGLGGIQVPGGIEFDLELHESVIAKIQEALQNLVPEGTDNFSWYRVPSKLTLPKGTSKVVIWLSQPN